jgi:hypothetical protein
MSLNYHPTASGLQIGQGFASWEIAFMHAWFYSRKYNVRMRVARPDELWRVWVR